MRVPALVMSDGPSGLRNGEPATALPAPITQAASFDRQLAHDYGKTIAQDAADRGQDLIFGPGFNLARNPQAGRTFEYFGEDPFLAGAMAAANVDGLQGAGVMATPAGDADDAVTVSVTVTNTGDRAGAVAPQVYVKKPAARGIQTPVRELVGFDKVMLQPGESKTLTMTVEPMQLSVWNSATHAYQVTPGTYTFTAGLDVDNVKGGATYTVR
ncbi:MAG: fibronectin type III-like domain-contianing protein [Bowdeniella nasicola]|nr:fibronectin type III-like domain-contianing protein [Bowdeniella nasicola]